jgi:hypothetical protein
MNKYLFFLLLSIISIRSLAQSFTEQTGFSFVGINEDNMEWGDYDNDGYLDFVVCSPYPHTLLYHSDGDTTFTQEYNIKLIKVDHADADWGDYNNDGFLDLIISGRDSSSHATTVLYKNNGNNTFTEQTNIVFDGAYSGSTKWGDYNNDGYIDLLIVGYNANGYIAKVYSNNGPSTNSTYSFTEETNIKLQGAWKAAADWVDYNNDGNLDIIISGDSAYYTPMTKIYKNNGDNSFSELDSIGIEKGIYSALSWGDYDNDGDLDLAIIGYSNIGSFTKIYKNEGNDIFVDQAISLETYAQGVVKCVDFDNDGDLDLFVSGYLFALYSHEAILYRNDGNNVFVEQTGMPWVGFKAKSADWGDFDNDGDVDVIITGDLAMSGICSRLYKNNLYSNSNPTLVNNKPTAPTGLSCTLLGDSILFTWNRATDSLTPDIALTYNIRIGNNIDSINIKSPSSDLNSGFHRVSSLGTIQDTFYILSSYTDTALFWSVQAIDNGYLASDFSLTDSISIPIDFIQNTTNKLDFTVFPNPAKDKIHILGLNINQISIYNITGSLIYSKEVSRFSGSHTVNINQLSKGIYIIAINTDSGILNKKIIIK